MLFVRTFDTKAIALQRTGKLGTYASCLGHEATHVGIGASMRPEDVFAPSYREYGAQFMRGVKPREVLMYWGGDERGNDFSGPHARLPVVRADRDAVPARGRRGARVQAAQGAARGGDLLRRRRLVEDRHLRRDQFRRRLHAAVRAVHHQQRLGDLGAALGADRRQDAGAEGHRRRPALPAGRRQRPDRGAWRACAARWSARATATAAA